MTKKNDSIVVWFLILVIFIVLPTFTPEDMITTIPIIKTIGLENYIILAVILVVLLGFIEERRKGK